MIPKGISEGGAIILERESETKISILPVIMERGTRIRCLEEKILRVMWGAVRPINPMIPPPQTAAAVPRLPAIKTR